MRLAKAAYEMTKYERKRGRIEVYARKGEFTVEVKIDARSGEVYEVEQKYSRRDDDGRYDDDGYRRGYDDDDGQGRDHS
ncbi:hypothetical protein [Dichotomicrobium thermohalophilum]|uniref:PepSY domain-containing protein n=1 Tax=Dichotomicrobium thermohalophilum TaxID=933063 RepID=A0A397Q5E6_9HYPH|nr:hypothetical protein [Dichotomicrobium thermohalophilum]RIA56278.1 hypothetical protein BXY53_1381 [Dichotomicrobium thermohalophilum]